MKEWKIALLPGDGVGGEVTREAVKTLEKIGELFSLSFVFTECPVGGRAIDDCGTPLPKETLRAVEGSSAILLGAVGGPKWDSLPTEKRPEAALLGLRSHLRLFCNLRPAMIFSELLGASPLKEEIVRDADIMVVRELTGDVYFGKPRGIFDRHGERVGINTLVYSETEIRRIARAAFKIAQNRRKKVTSVDKANVLESMALWREVVSDVGREFPDIELDHLYVDNCAMQLVRNPRGFDTILTTNLFGDILSDEAAMLTGSIGMLPSASLGETGSPGLFEPVHGSAPDIAGNGIVNPIATILSSSMMLDHAFGEREAARLVVSAVKKAIGDGYRTKDIYDGEGTLVSTEEMGDVIAGNLALMKE